MMLLRVVSVAGLFSIFGCAGESKPEEILGEARSALSAVHLFSPTSTPTSTNVGSGYDAEVGVTFTSDNSGTVDGLRFYKGTADTGPHTGHLWKADGTPLATITFTGESASGWQDMAFASPVPIVAGQTYIVSYHTNTGFSYDPYFFDTPLDVAPLHAPAGAGVYAFGPDPSFPTQIYLGANYWVDVDFTDNGPSGNSSIWQASDAPAGAGVIQGVNYELGTQFVPSVDGQITDLRYFRDPSDSGSHSGHLWDGAGNLLATQNFSGTASGWQDVALASPVSVLANHTYVVSYHTTTGFSYSASYFTAGRSAPPLNVPVDGGVYATGNDGTFPNQTYGSANYWADVVFATQAAPARLFTAASTPVNPLIGSGTQYELGVQFSASVAGSISKLRFYKGAGNDGAHVGHLFDGAGNLLATAAFSGETASGWQEVTLATPVTLTPNATYVASYNTSSGFSYDQGFFAAGFNNGALHVPVNGGVYAFGTSFPTQVYDGTNYWVDVQFDTGGACTPTCGGACGSSDSCGGTCCTGTSACTQIVCGECQTMNTCGGSCQAVADNTSCSIGTCQAGVCTAAATQYTVFNGQGSPGAVLDSTPYELGMQFTDDNAGSVTRIRFFKPVGAVGTHTGHLWDGAGNLLATVAFTGETASGWQEAVLGTPVAITAGATYVVSYSEDGGFSFTASYFDAAKDVAPLHVPVSGGVYGALGSFPTSVYANSSYSVDVVVVP